MSVLCAGLMQGLAQKSCAIHLASNLVPPRAKEGWGQAWAVGQLRGAGASVDVDATRAACKRHKKAPSPETVAAVEEALGLRA